MSNDIIFRHAYTGSGGGASRRPLDIQGGAYPPPGAQQGQPLIMRPPPRAFLVVTGAVDGQEMLVAVDSITHIGLTTPDDDGRCHTAITSSTVTMAVEEPISRVVEALERAGLITTESVVAKERI